MLRPDLPADVERETLWHEITHQALRVVAGHIDLDRKDEERIVAAIAWNQLDTLRRCPELVEYLTARESDGRS